MLQRCYEKVTDLSGVSGVSLAYNEEVTRKRFPWNLALIRCPAAEPSKTHAKFTVRAPSTDGGAVNCENCCVRRHIAAFFSLAR